MNLIPAKAILKNELEVELKFLGLSAGFRSKERITLPSEDVIIGVRPEAMPIYDGGKVEGVTYSTLPSGMETTVKISIADQLLSSVVFGSIDYAVDEKIKFDFSGDHICLFDKQSGERVALGQIIV